MVSVHQECSCQVSSWSLVTGLFSKPLQVHSPSFCSIFCYLCCTDLLHGLQRCSESTRSLTLTHFERKTVALAGQILRTSLLYFVSQNSSSFWPVPLQSMCFCPRSCLYSDVPYYTNFAKALILVINKPLGFVSTNRLSGSKNPVGTSRKFFHALPHHIARCSITSFTKSTSGLGTSTTLLSLSSKPLNSCGHTSRSNLKSAFCESALETASENFAGCAVDKTIW